MKKKTINLFAWNLFFCILLLNAACKKWIEVPPPTDSITGRTVFDNVLTSASVLNNIYSNLQALPFGYNLGYVADEISPRIADQNNFIYTNEYQGANTEDIDRVWSTIYGISIYGANLVIEGAGKSEKLSEANKRALIAEAKFIRALSYFYLVNLYGDVPLVLTPDYKINSNIPRSSQELIYEQIVEDLGAAKNDLPINYVGPDLFSPSKDRVRPTKWAASALLARVYLFKGEWSKAEENASLVISHSDLFYLENLEGVFEKTSHETILALQPNLTQIADAPNNTLNGQIYIPYPGGLPNTVINPSLLSKFLDNDQRKSAWLAKVKDESVIPNENYYYPFKYKLGSNFTGIFQDQREHEVILRLGEQYLIRAEARARLDRISGANSAADDLNVIRRRAGLGDTGANDQQSMLKAILDERQLELFSEWGHRWLDLKRTETVNEVMSIETPKKGGIWAPYKTLFPIPISEFLNNPALRGHQNPNYREN